MKIYNKVVIDIDTLEVVEEDSFEYSGPILEMKGDVDAVDKAFNRGMLKISQEQQEWANKFMNLYLTGTTSGYNDPNTISEAELQAKNIQDAYSLTGDETTAARSSLKLSTAQNEAQLGLVGEQTALERAEMAERQKQIAARSPLISQYYKDAAKGQDVTGEMNRAQADVAQSFGAARTSMNRNLALRGMGPASEATQREFAADQARAVSFARTQARRDTEESNLNRLRTALSIGDI